MEKGWKPELWKKILLEVIIRQRKQFRRRDGTYFEENAGVNVHNKGVTKGTCLKNFFFNVQTCKFSEVYKSKYTKKYF